VDVLAKTLYNLVSHLDNLHRTFPLQPDRFESHTPNDATRPVKEIFCAVYGMGEKRQNEPRYRYM